METKGYVGFGISPNGTMAGADIMIGYVENGNPIVRVSTIVVGKSKWHN